MKGTSMKSTKMTKTTKTNLRKSVGILGTAALALAAVAAGAAPAHANPNWTLYNEGTAAPLTSADVVSATGTAVFGLTLAGSPQQITCTFDASNPLRISATGPVSGAPGSTLTVNATPPPSVACKNQGGVPVPVTTAGAWSVALTAPAAGSAPGQLYDGVLAAGLNIPANGVTIDLSSFAVGCSVTGPTAAKSFGGSYDAGPGVLTTSANQGFAATSTGCVVTSTRLSSARLTVNPVLDLQW
jgi:hypothetical protein